MKEWLKKYGILALTMLIMAIAIILGINLYQNNNEYKLALENSYNYSFYEMLNYVDSMETYLAKSIISKSANHSAETLTYVWRDANLAENSLSQIPVSTDGLSNASKFLNQVSDYSYSLSRKNIKNKELTDEELENLNRLHEYSVQLKNSLNELSDELNNGSISWKELTKKTNKKLSQQVSNVTQDSFDSIEGTFDDYTGLIYDGAFSEHMTSIERKGLTGEEVDEEKAKEIAKKFIGEEKVKEVSSNGFTENGNIPLYSFNLKLYNEDSKSIAIAKKGGHVVYLNSNRNIEAEIISEEEAKRIAGDFLDEKGYENMKSTYTLTQQGEITINFAYEQDKVICYPDLIKVKVALDNGEIMGFEATGYLNCHTERNLKKNIIDKEIAKKKINKNLEITNERLAIIPTEYNTEIYCWEFQGKVDEKEFLVYINAETGEEEDILVIVNTPNGKLTT